MPLVSIGIPFLNPGPFFQGAVRSVFAQTYADWELILIDDGSTDGSLQAARSIRSGRVSVIWDGERKGLPARLNQIAKIAQGKYVARMDADDLMHPMRLMRQVDFLERTGAEAVITGAWMIDNRDGVRGRGRSAQIPGRGPDIRSVLRWGFGIHPTLMGLRAWFVTNPYDPAYPRAEDRELFVRTFGKSRIESVEENLLFYRRPDNVVVRSCLQSYASERKVLREYGPALVGGAFTFYLIQRSYLKAVLLRTAAHFGRAGRILKMRFLPVSDEERAKAEAVVGDILKAKVPGWDN